LNVPALAVGALSGLITLRGLVRGDSRGFQRSVRPVWYWLMIFISSAIAAFLIYIGLTTESLGA